MVVLVCLVGWLGWLECGTGVTEVTGSLRLRERVMGVTWITDRLSRLR